MSSLCVTCSSDQDVLVSMSEIEWDIFCLLLYPHENIAENSKLTKLKNSNFVRICIACQNTLASIGLFQKCARANFKKFVDMWNMRPRPSHSIIDIDPVSSMDTIILESVDFDNVDIIIEDFGENENLDETVPTNPTTVFLNSEDIQIINEEKFVIEEAEIEIEEVMQTTSQPDLPTTVLNKFRKTPEKGSSRGRGSGRGRRVRGRGAVAKLSDAWALARPAGSPAARKRPEGGARATELHRVLLPDAPPRKRRRNIPSPERQPCVIEAPSPMAEASVAGPSQRTAPSHSAPSPAAEASVAGPSQRTAPSHSAPSPAAEASVAGPSQRAPPSHSAPSPAAGVGDKSLDDTATDWLALIDDMDEIDDPDMDVDPEDPATFTHGPDPHDATLEPATTEDISPAEIRILRLNDQADDVALREIAPRDIDLNFDWTNERTSFVGKRETFTGPTPGPTFDMTDDTSPVDVFYKMFDSDFVELLVTETNRYARQVIDTLTKLGKLKPSSRLSRWTPTDKDEMITFLAVMILQGLYPLPREETYFRFNGFGTMPYMNRIMSYNRFSLLKTLLHFVDNEIVTEKTKLSKIQPVLDYLDKKFSSLYNLSQNIAIDESLLKWHGRLSFSQKIKTKAAQVGVKTYELCESSTGYLWRFFVYTGKSKTPTDQTPIDQTPTDQTPAEQTPTDQTPIDHTPADQTPTDQTPTDQTPTTSTVSVTNKTRLDQSNTRPTSATAKIVYDLVEPLLYRGHALIMDNFYNCPLLARCLKRQKTDNYGTLRLNREFVPNALKQLTKADLRQGEVVTSYCPDLAVMVWRDANLVSMISTCHALQVRQHQKNNRLTYKPDLVLDYNKNMGGVDRKDQYLSAVPVERLRNKVWYKKLFRRLYNAAIFNCFVLYHTSRPKMTHRHFRETLAEDLLRRHRRIDLTLEPRLLHKRTGDNTKTTTRNPPAPRNYGTYGVFLDHNHFPEHTGSKYTRCFLCSKAKKLARTVWRCEECKINLCVSICFKEYHKIHNVFSDNVCMT